MSRFIFVFASVLTGSFGCSSSPAAPTNDTGIVLGGETRTRQIAAASSVADSTASTSSLGAAFAHAISKSRFSVGASLIEKDEHGMHKFVGDQGVFAVLPSGKSLASPNANAVARQHPGPLPGGAARHNLAVQEYFVGAGLPASQIASVDIMPAMTQSLDVASQKLSTPKLEYYVSLIRRQIVGVPVVDSYARARINEDGAVVEESVYWPQISATTVADAQAFAAKLGLLSSRESYVAALPGSKSGQLLIRHTPGEWSSGFVSAALFDVPDDNKDFGNVVHFDSAGKRVILPHEAPGAWGPLPAASKRSN